MSERVNANASELEAAVPPFPPHRNSKHSFPLPAREGGQGVGRIGADRAGYVTVAIPVVALLLSGLFEGLPWNGALVLGVLLCLAGNVVVMGGRAVRRLDD